VTLPDDIGKPVAVAVSAKETQLIIATYDAGSPNKVFIPEGSLL